MPVTIALMIHAAYYIWEIDCFTLTGRAGLLDGQDTMNGAARV